MLDKATVLTTIFTIEVDFVGRAEYGVCSSKAMKYFGLKLHSVVSLSGVVIGFLHTGASHYDNQAVVELLESFALHLTRLLGDGAYSVVLMVNQLLGRPLLRLAGLPSSSSVKEELAQSVNIFP
jgi:Transposase DDE domain